MKILITGGAGFVGSNLANYLTEKGHKIVAYDNMHSGSADNLLPDVHLIKADIRNLYRLNAAISGNELVFHFAGLSALPDCQFKPDECQQVNVTGTLNVLNACVRNDARMIFSSTSAVYENGKENRPHLMYSVSKSQGELLCNSYRNCFKLPVKILRFFNVYGPGQDILRKNPPFVGYVIKQMLEKKPLEIYSTEARRDYIYIKDICKYTETILTQDFYEDCALATNLCSGHSYTTLDIIQQLEFITGINTQIIQKDPLYFWHKYATEELYDKFDENRLVQEVNKNVVDYLRHHDVDETPLKVGLEETYNEYKRIYDSSLPH